MDTVRRQTSPDFVYSCEIVPLAQLMDKKDSVLLLNAYLHNRPELLEHLPAIEEAVDRVDEDTLKSILWYCQPQNEPENERRP